MSNRIKLIKTSWIKIREDLYPRAAPSYTIIKQYTEVLKSGGKFPPIIVNQFGNQYLLIDGYHRLNAHKLAHIEDIEAEILHLESEKDIFIESIKRNNTHGKSLTSNDKKIIILKLEQLEIDKINVNQLLGLTNSKITELKANVITNNFNGKKIYLRPLTASLSKQIKTLDTLILLIETDKLLKWNKKINERFVYLKKLITSKPQTIKESVPTKIRGLKEDEQGIVLRMYYKDGIDPPEISKELGASIDSIEDYIHSSDGLLYLSVNKEFIHHSRLNEKPKEVI